MSIQKVTLFVSNVPIVIAAIYAVRYYNRFERILKTLSWFLVLTCVIQMISMVFWLYSTNNLPILHIYVLLGTVALLMFYNTIIQEYFKSRFLIWVGAGFAIFAIVNSLFFEGILTFNSNALIVQSILLIIISAMVYLLSLNGIIKAKNEKIWTSIRWINSGIFIYFLSSLLLFYFGEILMKITPVEFRMTWILHALFITVMYTMILIGLWKYPKK